MWLFCAEYKETAQKQSRCYFEAHLKTLPALLNIFSLGFCGYRTENTTYKYIILLLLCRNYQTAAALGRCQICEFIINVMHWWMEIIPNKLYWIRPVKTPCSGTEMLFHSTSKSSLIRLLNLCCFVSFEHSGSFHMLLTAMFLFDGVVTRYTSISVHFFLTHFHFLSFICDSI